jgi:serine phosphatase RsbU (regulator of sigma subunit)
VLRDGRRLTLNVTLARFGVPIPQLMLYFAGLVMMAFGAWLLWVRPGLPPARQIGLGYLAIGFGCASILLQREGGAGVATLGAVVPASAVLAGMALVTRSTAHFPREWPALASARWFPATLYVIVATGVALFAWTRHAAAFFGAVAAIGATGVVARWRFRRTRSPEHRRMGIAMAIAGTLAVAAAFGVVMLLSIGAPNNALTLPFAMFAGVLIAMPLAYLYTIGRFRIFDLRLRMRRNVQYSLVSFSWLVLPLAVLAYLVWLLSQSSLPLPGIRMTGTSVELMDSGAAPAREAAEKAALMILAIGLAFGLREVALRGQRFLDTKYHRGGYDYRKASQSINEVTSTRLDLQGLSEGVVGALVEAMPLKRAGIVLAHGARTHCPSTAHGFTDRDWLQFCERWAGELLAVMKDARAEMSAAYAPPRIGDALRAAELEYTYPLRAKDVLVGVLVVGEKQSEAVFQNDDFEFLAAMASQVAAGVENAFLYQDLAGQERLKHELQIARQIQMESLPQFTPQVDGLDVAGISIPAFEVGGDYFDYLNGHPERLTVMVGDVSGKGTSAALYMSKLQGIMRSLHGFDLSPHELFVRTNQLLCRDLERRAFVTAIGGFFDTQQRHVVLARAGHLPLYHYRADRREVMSALPRGLGFGLSTRPIFSDELEEHLIAYRPGDVFLFVTDGITDCQNPSGELYGEERLVAAFADEAPTQPTAAALRDAITTRVTAFSEGRDPFDDITVVVVKAI